MCISKKLKFIKEQEAKGLLSITGIRSRISQIPMLGSLLFQNIKWIKW